LAHEQAKLPFHFVTPFPGNKAEHARLARSRVKQTGEHFEHRGFTRAVRAEKTDKLAFLNLK
jgi:hypothetical protein